jgi:hypoxanthine phosphoribosyltransferase
MKSYDYAQRKGIEEITWDRFAQLCIPLTEKLAALQVEVIVGIARAGLFPATAVSTALRRELYPVRITRRVNDRVKFQHPVWRVDVSADVKDKVVAVVDEIADTGETLALVADRVKEKGAKQVITACLVSHSWADPAPDVVALISDAFIIFPWDRQVFIKGEWQRHPEIEEALSLQTRTE